MWRLAEIVACIAAAAAIAVTTVGHWFDPAFSPLGWVLSEQQTPWRWQRTPMDGLHALVRAAPWLAAVGHVLLLAVLLAGAAVVAWGLWRLARRQVQARQMVRYRLSLGRDDTAQPLTVSALLDAWAQAVESRYFPALMGNDPVTLDIVRDEAGLLRLYVRGTRRTVGSLVARLRATWTSVRTHEEAVPAVEGPYAASVTPRHRDTTTRGFRSYRDYSHSVTESVLAVLDEADGTAHLQYVLSPRSAKFNAGAERRQRQYESKARARGAADPSQAGMSVGETAQLQATIKAAGRQWWRTEIRVVAQEIATLQAIVGALNEAAAENSWVYHRVVIPAIRRRWEAWRRTGMPGVYPAIGCTSLPGVFISTLWQLPSARLRVSGLLREPTRRGPAVLSIPTADERDEKRPRGVVPVKDEEGRLVLLPEADLVPNALAVGSHGTGKSTVLRRFWQFAANRADWAGVLIDPKGSLAEAAKGLVSKGRPVACWHVGQPSVWGYNPFLSGQTQDWDLTTDRILGAMKQAWGDGIMARSEDYLRHAIAATLLLGHEGEGFAFVQQVLATPSMWAGLAETIPDEGVAAWFRQMADRAETDPRGVSADTAAPLNKLGALLFGARRAAATASLTSIDLTRLLQDRGLLVVNLSADTVGDESAALLAILLLAGLWDAIRAARAPTMLVLDEAHRFLGESFFRLIAEGREFGARTVIGLQFLAQIADERAKNTVRELLQNLFLFRTQNIQEAMEHNQLLARVFATMVTPDEELQDRLAFTPDDFVNLPNYRAITRMLVGGRPQPAFLAETIQTEPVWEGAPWGACPAAWLRSMPDGATILVEAEPAGEGDDAEPEPSVILLPAGSVRVAGAGAAADSEPVAAPVHAEPASSGIESSSALSAEEIERLNARYGAEATVAALRVLAGRRAGVKHPAAYAEEVARREVAKRR